MLATTTSGLGYQTSTVKGRFHAGRPSKQKLNTETLATTKVYLKMDTRHAALQAAE